MHSLVGAKVTVNFFYSSGNKTNFFGSIWKFVSFKKKLKFRVIPSDVLLTTIIFWSLFDDKGSCPKLTY